MKNKKAFTLVELIVVITILAILGTIAFISLQGYSSSARNSRRISDINNIKTSLELFILNSGVYPTPDNYETVSYGGDELWYQGVIGDNVTKNLSKNLPKKPIDPQYEIEYTYSITNTKKEYELLAFYEGSIAQNQILTQANATTNVTPKILGNYNQLYVKSANYIVPTPSIINAEVSGTGIILNENNIKSQILTEGENIPNLNIGGIETQTGKLEINLSIYTGSITKESTSTGKILAIEKIQQAYSGTTLSNNGIYKYILGKTNDEEKLGLAETVLLNNNFNFTTNDDGGDQVVDLNGNDSYTKLLIHSDNPGINISDNFDGSSIDTTKWGIIDGTTNLTLTGAISIYNNKLKFYLPNTNTSNVIPASIGLGSKYKLIGDFNVQLDEDSSGVLNDPTYIVQSQMRLNTTGGQVYTLGDWKDSSNKFYSRTSNQTNCSSYIKNVTTYYNNNTSYKFVRTNGTLNAYIKNINTPSQDWYLYSTCSSFGTNISYLGLYTYSNNGTNNIHTAYFDNFIVNSGNVVSASFKDSSLSNNTITGSGNSYHSTNTAKFGSTSMYFDGTSSYLSIPDSDNWNFGSGDFTIDFWGYPSNLTNDNIPAYIGRNTGAGTKFTSYIYFKHNLASGNIFANIQDSNSVNYNIITTTPAPTNGFHHYALIRNNNLVKLYLDGVSIGQVDIGVGTNTNDVSTGFAIGSDGAGNYFNGYIDEFRVSKGIARRTSNFTPPIAPYGN